MHSFSASKLLLISALSRRRWRSWCRESAARSLPARSTSASLPCSLLLASRRMNSHTACDLDDVSLAAVACVVRALHSSRPSPSTNTAATARADVPRAALHASHHGRHGGHIHLREALRDNVATSVFTDHHRVAIVKQIRAAAAVQLVKRHGQLEATRPTRVMTEGGQRGAGHRESADALTGSRHVQRSRTAPGPRSW